jgi:hypothetical protein
MMFERILRVFKLDRRVFVEIENDAAATSQAAIVVAIVAVSAVIGAVLLLPFQALLPFLRPGDRGIGAVLFSIVVAIIGTFVDWLIWSASTYIVGTQLFKGRATFTGMLRVLGFAYAPRVLGIIPCIGDVIGAIWSLIAGYFAIREGHNLDDGGTIITILIGWVLALIIRALIGAIAGVGFLGGIF